VVIQESILVLPRVTLEYRLREPMHRQEVLILRESSVSIKNPLWAKLSQRQLKICWKTFSKVVSNWMNISLNLQKFKSLSNPIMFFNKSRTSPTSSKIIYFLCRSTARKSREINLYQTSINQVLVKLSVIQLLHLSSLWPILHFWISQCRDRLINPNIIMK